jgi:signal transduction histidine kinase
MSAIRAMEDEIRHLDTLAAIGRFASAMAHEIRNPLGGISAGVGFLARSELSEEHRENLEVIQGEIARLDGIIRNLLSVARPRELLLAPVQPQELVNRAVSSLERWARERQVRVLVKAEEHGPVYVDWDMMQQVLVNLLKNAIEASPSPGIVNVALTEPPNASGKGGIRITVTDHGPGVDPEDMPRLFEPFFSRKAQGTGLGLYVCHSFVQRHGGDLTVERAESGGARFEIRLPRTPAHMGASHESATTHR